MNFNHNEEQGMLREAAARFVKEQHGLEKRRAMLASKQTWSKQRWQQYAEFGWLGLGIAEEFGGIGRMPIEMAVVAEELGFGFVVDPFASNVALVTHLLQDPSVDERHRTWLPLIASGELMSALAYEEPGRGYGQELPQVCASRKDGGYSLTGLKTLVVGGDVADQALVTAHVQRDGAAMLAIFAADCSAPGLAKHAYPLIDGRGCADFVFEGVQCSDDDLVLCGAVAHEALDAALDHTRVVALAEALGGMEACMAMTAEHLKTRSQFGNPLSSFQSLQHKMADMFVDVQDARSCLYRALAHLDSDPYRRRRAVASAQLMVGEAGRRVTAAGVQLHGGYGMTDEYAISHAFRQQLVLQKLWGDSQDCLERMDWDS